jgi:hypothetical protein
MNGTCGIEWNRWPVGPRIGGGTRNRLAPDPQGGALGWENSRPVGANGRAEGPVRSPSPGQRPGGLGVPGVRNVGDDVTIGPTGQPFHSSCPQPGFTVRCPKAKPLGATQ